MRRTGGFVLVIVGLFLIFLAPLLRWYTYPRVLKAPLDIYDTSTSPGTGTYFSLKELQVVGPHRLVNTSTARGDVDAGSKSVAVYDYFSTTRDVDAGGGVIDASTDRYVFDRVTGAAVHCCGEHPRHEGITLKFPFYTQRRTYMFWDGTLGAAAPAVYSGESTLAGLKVYVFKQHIPPTIIDHVTVSGQIAGTPDVDRTVAFVSYRADTTLWVEPFTGAIIKGAQHATRILQNGGVPIFTLADTNLANDQATIESTASTIRSKYNQLNLVRFWLPLIGPIVGIVLIVVGLLMIVRTPAPAPAAAESETVAA